MKYIFSLFFFILFFSACVPKNSIKAAKYGEVNNMKIIVNNGYNINYCYNSIGTINNNCTPLRVATVYSQYEMVKYLLQNGADITLERNKFYGYGLLSQAIASGDHRIVKILIDSNVYFNTNIIGIDKYMFTCAKEISNNLKRFAQKYHNKLKYKKQILKQQKINDIKNNKIDNLLGI